VTVLGRHQDAVLEIDCEPKISILFLLVKRHYAKPYCAKARFTAQGIEKMNFYILSANDTSLSSRPSEARAGIQTHKSIFWIPAFAGMTYRETHE
jgi:hypothetical protein